MMKTPSEEEMHAAVAGRNAAFDGRFFYGVTTTRIFCRPSCRSRAAKVENLHFFPDAESAVEAGFRPCKRCRPLEAAPGLARLVKIARFIDNHADERLTLEKLAKRANLSKFRFQRNFKRVFGISPKLYQDAVRVRRLKSALKNGDDVTDAILSAGFGSVSRVYGEDLRSVGMTPKSYREGGAGETIAYACRGTSYGPLMMGATERGVCFVQFGKDRKTLFGQLQAEFPNADLHPSPAQNTPALEAWLAALDAHLAQGAPRPELPLDLRGTAFQMKVWRFLLSIKEGEVISYGELAAQIGNPRAARAVASACGANRIGLLVPCHRVLRGDGGLGGYRWGLERKKALLDAERSRVRGVR